MWSLRACDPGGLRLVRASTLLFSRQDFFDADIHTRNFNAGHLSIDASLTTPQFTTSLNSPALPDAPKTPSTIPHGERDREKEKMATPINTLLIEGTFTELVDELAQYVDALRKSAGTEGSLREEIAPALDKLREKEGSEQEQSEAEQKQVLSQRDEVLKKVVVACQLLNSAPEKGGLYPNSCEFGVLVGLNVSGLWNLGYYVVPALLTAVAQKLSLLITSSSTLSASPARRICSLPESATS